MIHWKIRLNRKRVCVQIIPGEQQFLKIRVLKLSLVPSFFLKDTRLGLVGGVFQMSKAMGTNFRAAGLKVGLVWGRGYRRKRMVTYYKL